MSERKKAALKARREAIRQARKACKETIALTLEAYEEADSK